VALLDRLADEYRRTVDVLLRIRESDGLLEGEPVLRAAIALRNPYVDPLSLLQVGLLARRRAEGGEEDGDPEVREALASTLSGLAQGLRNTG
jgi:phosphoenolpyruvate carboxylase